MLAGRPVSPVSFASFDFRGRVEVTVRLLDGLRQAGVDTSSLLLRPLAHGLRPEVRDGAVQFAMTEPCQLSLEPGGGTRQGAARKSRYLRRSRAAGSRYSGGCCRGFLIRCR